MFDRLKRLYQAGRIGVEELDQAVSRGWITAAQKQEIVGE